MAKGQRLKRLLEAVDQASEEDRQTIIELMEAQQAIKLRRNVVDRRPASGLWLVDSFPRKGWLSVITTKVKQGQPIECQVCGHREWQFSFLLSHRHWPDQLSCCASCSAWLCRKA
jgi:hypothetical protein